MENEKTILVFCAAEQKETDHTVTVDANGEIVLTCISEVGTEAIPATCGRFIKYPRGTNAETLKSHLVAHKKANEGQVSTEGIERERDQLMADLNEKE